MTEPAVDPADAAEAPRRPRSYAVALGSLALGAVLLLVASGRTWVQLVLVDPGLPSLTVTISGNQLTYGAPLAILALAGIAGLVALRRAGRMVAGVVLLLAAVPAAVRVLLFATSSGSADGAGRWISEIAGEQAGVAVDAGGAAVSPWWLLELGGVLLVALAGVLALVASRSWPQLGRRYERDGDAGPRPAAAPPATSAWDQLDAGVDPTLDAPADPAPDARADDPDRAT